jgi:integrase
VYTDVYIKTTWGRGGFSCTQSGLAVALTDAWLKAQAGKTRDKVEEKADRDGLSVRISRKGKIVFQLRYRLAGKPARVDLGSYPATSLKDARDEAVRLRGQHEKGEDPRIVKKVERQAIAGAPTFEALFRDWIAKAGIKKKDHADILRSFELHVFPRVGDLPANRITLHAWLDLLEDLAARIPSIAERVLTNAKQCYWWGIKRKLVTENPLASLDGRSDLNIERNERVRPLADRELWYIWHAMMNSRLSGKNKLMMMLCLAYSCRWSEVRLAEKAHVDFNGKVWTVPPENHKNGWRTGKPIIRPLLPHTEDMFRQAFALSGDSKFVFISGRTGKVLAPSSQTSWTYEIQRWVWRHCNVVMQHWTLHDFRATARTKFSKLTQPHVAEKMVGHKLAGVWELYDRYGYLEEQAEAYAMWWSIVQQITAADPATLPATVEAAAAPAMPPTLERPQ